MKHLRLTLAVATAAIIVLAGCSQPAAQPTAAPKAAEPTKAAQPAAQPTSAPVAQPTAAPAAKATWPEKGKAITIIVPSNAGGSTDLEARMLAPLMEKDLGVPVQVVDKPGAGQQIGLTEMTGSKPDGYTIGFSAVPQAMTIYLDPERKAVFNRKSFVPIAMHVIDPGAAVVKKESPYKNMKELIDFAKANPYKIKATTSGILSDDHINLLLTEKATGAKFTIVHMDSSVPTITALLGDNVDLNFNNVGDYMSQSKAGTVRFLAVMDKQRNGFYPDIPTMTEMGWPVESASSRLLSAPAGTPAEVVNILSASIKKAMDTDQHKGQTKQAALSQVYMDPAQTAEYWDKMESTIKPLMALANEK